MSTDDESFHPLGEEWEDELETMLDDTEYDSELGMDMAQDAMRVTKGELSEAEFHERYHEDVMEEFGEDERPTKEAYEAAKEETKGTVSRMLDAFDGDGEESRREAMKKMGVGATAVGMGAFGTVAEGPEQSLTEAESGSHSETKEKPDTQWGMTIDLERCDGCLSCMVACTEENQLDQGVNWMYVMAWEDELHSAGGHGGSGGNESEGHSGSGVYTDFNMGSDFNMLVRPCQHCTDAPCEKVCPTTARHTRDKDGLVLTDYDVCIGCRYCQVACPYGVNYFQWDEPDTDYSEMEEEATMGEYEYGERWVDARAPRGAMSKCVFCPSMQDGKVGEDKVGTTACETACPPNAIQFGNVNDERSDASQHRDHPTKSRAIVHLTNGTESSKSAPSPDQIDSTLSQDDDIESAIEKLTEGSDGSFDEGVLAVMKAVEIVSEGLEPNEEVNDTILEQEQQVLASVEAIQQYVDLDSEEALEELQLGEGTEQDAQFRLEQYAGDPTSFKLLEDIGTHPNVTYLGQEPGPEAEQVSGPTKYEDVGLLDKRQEALNDGTVGWQP
ncbi:4Fe-4S ferredoxin N-terminal domain-containing protein [Natrinema sp. 1APR25-10V2]|uniref:4Fe-4S ferredoxin N-terminal domain-containing protein n=1 Tax=Natrinema sp. 1APR25-10V2 TaxID=2951081 RepID=UPI002876922C|nr:4Fe-4S ferredoxin N-terminal domain-containing protein [Natrinema sp. 1APR25-10V2]MDS0477462.1 4Fe-4S dicluster domain-containing protein [Natrinema sp. 1APR25-10V2]